MNKNFEKWMTQYRKGILELCVLAILQKNGRNYGFELFEVFSKSGLDVNEGTLYPLLNRMQNNGWLESEWQPPINSGNPRKYYKLTQEGKLQLPLMMNIQNVFSQALNNWEQENGYDKRAISEKSKKKTKTYKEVKTQ